MNPLPFHIWQELKLKEFEKDPEKNKRCKPRHNWWATAYGGYCNKFRQEQVKKRVRNETT